MKQDIFSGSSTVLIPPASCIFRIPWMTPTIKTLICAVAAGQRLNKYTLFTPGPIDVPDDVLQETAQSLVYHREEQFGNLLSEIADKLRHIISSNDQIFFFTSSGTGAMEAACSNILSSSDVPIVAVCGKFGERWLELCETYRIQPIVIREDYGKSINPERIEAELKKCQRPTVIFTTLTETSTGALDDIKAFGEISEKYDSLLVVDGVAGLGADFCPQQDWHIDVLVGASQKALMAPPGISFLAASKKALEKMRTSDLPKYYFHIPMYEKFVTRYQTPFTPAITILYGLRRGLETILKRGVNENFNRHKTVAQHVRKRIEDMGYDLLPEFPSNALTVVKMRSTIDSTEVIKEIKEKYHILFANGQQNLKGKIIRIGHMGNYDVKKMDRALDVLHKVLKRRENT
jgi:aspartate aminotransferase-like enzyme